MSHNPRPHLPIESMIHSVSSCCHLERSEGSLHLPGSAVSRASRRRVCWRRLAWAINLGVLMRTLFSLILLSVFASSQTPPAKPPKFEDVAKQVGLTVSHVSSPEKRYIVESMSGGVGLIDCDNDGKLDLITVNGSTVDRYKQGGDPMITLYHQDDGFRFTDISKTAGLTRKGWGMGVAVADYDNDGLPDIYVTGYGGNVLYHNLGNCKFKDVTDKSGVAAGGFSTGAAWADYDRDGYVDLFVSRYVHFDVTKLPDFGKNEKNCSFKGIPVQCGPWGMLGESDLLFHNRGDGTFEEVSKKAGVDDPNKYYGLGVIWADYDNDGWPDLYVANDSGPNYLYHNKHDGTFEEVGMLSGAAVSGDGSERGNMGVDWSDYLHEGRLSVFVTTFTEQPDSLYRNLGAQGFSEVSYPAKLAKPTYNPVGWGTGFLDMDNDGWPDLFVANGHVYPQMDQVQGAPRYREPMLLFRNNRDGTFEDVSSVLAGIPDASRRGAAFGDLNNDGNVDIVVMNTGRTANPAAESRRKQESSGAVQAGRDKEQQNGNRLARHRKSRKAGANQRGSRRRQLPLAERSATPLRPRHRSKNRRSGNQMAKRQD